MMENEDNVVSSSTSGITLTPYVINLRLEIHEEVSNCSFDSIEAFLNEPATTQPNMVHTTGAEYEQILGMPLSDKLKNMTEDQKTLVLNKLKETKRWKRKYIQNKRATKTYMKNVNLQKKKAAQLLKEVKKMREEVKVEKAEYISVQKGLEEKEEELQKFQKELKRKLRFNREMDQLRSEKESIERDIRIKSRLTLKFQKKLYNKVEIEKELKASFKNNIDFMQEVSEILVEKKVLPVQKQEEVDNSIVDWKMQLALYEDSNMDEIDALHDGKIKLNEQEEAELLDEESMDDEI